MVPYVNIHTHRPTGRGVELRTEGIHPWRADRAAAEEFAARLDGQADDRSDGHVDGRLDGLDGRVQAIGEIGLDYASTVDRQLQLDVLRMQLALARRRGLPVVLHCVRAFEPLMRELAACPPRAVIFHGFIGSPEQARQALGRGYMLSFGERTFASPKSLRALQEVPLTQLFLETDDDPVTIESIYERVAALRGIELEVLKRATLENYERIFAKQNG